MGQIGFILRTLNFKSETFLINIIKVVSQKHSVHVYYERGTKSEVSTLVALHSLSSVSSLSISSSIMAALRNPLGALNIYFRLNGPEKRKILDLPILLNSKLSHIYFPFGYNTTHRAGYGQYMGITSSVSFMGSDILVWPKQKNYDYQPLLEKIDKIHCNSTIIEEEVVKIEGNSLSKTLVIPSGLREDFEYKFRIKELMEIRKSVYQVKGEQIITIGRLNWIKGYESILQSLAILKRTQKFIYHIVGYGEDGYKLKTMVEKLGLEEFVVFHGYQNTREVIELLKKATLYVQTFWSEGFSNSVLEAQAMGLYSVVTPVSGMTDIINDANKGIVLEDFQNEALTKCLEWVLTKEHFESRMEQTANLRNSCLNLFGFKTFEKNWLAFFDSVA